MSYYTRRRDQRTVHDRPTAEWLSAGRSFVRVGGIPTTRARHQLEQRIGRLLRPDEVAHHLDLNPANDSRRTSCSWTAGYTGSSTTGSGSPTTFASISTPTATRRRTDGRNRSRAKRRPPLVATRDAGRDARLEVRPLRQATRIGPLPAGWWRLRRGDGAPGHADFIAAVACSVDHLILCLPHVRATDQRHAARRARRNGGSR